MLDRERLEELECKLAKILDELDDVYADILQALEQSEEVNSVAERGVEQSANVQQPLRLFIVK